MEVPQRIVARRGRWRWANAALWLVIVGICFLFWTESVSSFYGFSKYHGGFSWANRGAVTLGFRYSA